MFLRSRLGLVRRKLVCLESGQEMYRKELVEAENYPGDTLGGVLFNCYPYPQIYGCFIVEWGC